MTIDKNLQLKSGETPEQYRARVSTYQEGIRPASSLKNTLPSGTENLGQLDILKMALQETTSSMKKEGLIRNFSTTEAKFREYGLDPVKMAGSVSEGIMDFVSKRTRDPNEALQSFTGLIDMVQTKAKEDTALKRETFGTLLSKPGMLADWDDDTVQLWADSTGLGYDVVKKFRDGDKIDTLLVNSLVEGFNSGKYGIDDLEDISTDRVRNEVIKELDWDKVSTNNTNEPTYEQNLQIIEDNPDQGYEDLLSQLTKKPEDGGGGMSRSDAEEALELKGRFSEFSMDNAQKGIEEEIYDYMQGWKEGGDKAEIGTGLKRHIIGTRENLIRELVNMFPEYSEDQLHKMVFDKITNEWLRQNKKGSWIKPYGIEGRPGWFEDTPLRE